MFPQLPTCLSALLAHAAAYIARKQRVALAMIDTDEEAREIVIMPGKKGADEPMPSFECFIKWDAERKEAAQLEGSSEMEKLASSIKSSWAFNLGKDAHDPESWHSTPFQQYRSKTWPAGMLAANVRREQEMARRLRELCSGELKGARGKKKSVVVVVGKNHVHPLRMLLQQATL